MTERQIRALVARVVHPGTPEEERRTAAVIVIAELHARGAIDRALAPPAPAATASGHYAPRHRPERHVPVTVQFEGRCRVCRGTIYTGETAWWSPDARSGSKLTHDGCRAG